MPFVDKYSLFKYNLKGKVKSVLENSYEATYKFGNIEKGAKKRESQSDFEILFNDKGRLIEEVTIDMDGKMFSKWIFKHNDNEKILEKSHFNCKGNFLGKWTYTYNEVGLRIEKKWDSPHADLCKKEFLFYNENGKVEERKVFNHTGDLYLSLKYTYDAYGNRIGKNTYGSDNKLFLKHIYKYNKMNLVSEIEWKDILGKIGVKENYEYDDNGQIIKKVITNYKSSVFDFIYNYDELKNLAEILWIEKRNNLVRKGHSEYKYDKFGNWTERIDYKNDMLQYIVERKIMYYK